MVNQGNASQAAALREEGNGFYKRGRIDDALNAYLRASEITPDDPAPFSNLSAASFEAGKYSSAIDYAEQALAKLGDASSPLRQRLYTRITKAHVHLKQFDEAKSTLSNLMRDGEYTTLDGTLQQIGLYHKALPDEKQMLVNIVSRVPRYKPSSQDAVEYFTIGHDCATSQFDAALCDSSTQDAISIFFAGIGDARHFYATIADIARHERNSKKMPKRKYHFTVLDLKAPAIARDLIILYLLVKLSKIQNKALPEWTDTLTAVYFIFATPIVPGHVYETLQRTAREIISDINDPGKLPDWLYLYEPDKEAVVKTLRSWETETLKRFDTCSIRQLAMSHNVKTSMQLSAMGGQSLVPPGCEKERARFLETGMLEPAPEFLKRHDEELQKLLGETSKKSKTEMGKYLDVNWKTNVTIIDLEWEDNKWISDPPDMGFHPFDIAGQLIEETGIKPKNPKRLFDYTTEFFIRAARALGQLEGQLTIEVVMGELLETLEKIRFGLLDRRSDTLRGEKNSESDLFPLCYDRIHMSNIPDYIGGSLTSLLYSMPVLKPSKTSWLSSNCLRNSNQWKTINDFNNEYFLINDGLTMQKLTLVQLVHDQPILKADPRDINPYLMANYINYQRDTSISRIPFKHLVTRAELERWLYAHFFKLAIPVERAIKGWSLIYAPLNLTMFFRILSHLHEIGYPAHWLSEVLHNIISNTVHTTARPPRTSPLKIAEVKAANPMRKICTAPFVPELSTLTTLWQHSLPFGVISPDLPSVSDIHRYQIMFESVHNTAVSTQTLMLLFLDISYMKESGKQPVPLRPFLVDDETGHQKADAVKWREKGLIAVTTLNWNPKEKRAEFWMRDDLVQRWFEEKRWLAFLWRTDVWIPQSQPVIPDQRWVKKMPTLF